MRIIKTANYKRLAQNHFYPGELVQISEGSGIDSGKIVTIVNGENIQTDGRGIPTNVDGAYQPVDWSKEVAIQYEDGSFGLMFTNRLIRLPEIPSQNVIPQQPAQVAPQDVIPQ